MFCAKLNEATSNTTAAEVLSLNLNNCEAASFEGLTSEYSKLGSLTAANNKLQSLKEFPNLPSLSVLDLSNNAIAGGIDHIVDSCGDKIATLDLSNNQIATIDILEPLSKCSALKELNLLDNEVCEIEDYRVKVLAILPQLEVLDKIPVIQGSGDTNGETPVNGLGTKRHGEDQDESEPSEKVAKVDEPDTNGVCPEDETPKESATNGDSEEPKSEEATEAAPSEEAPDAVAE